MLLKNKKTGETGELQITEKHCAVAVGNGTTNCGIEIYSSLAGLSSEWEDAPEEPKGIQCIYYVNHFDAAKIDGVIVVFETKEEAEKAVEKLKAWKRLKDKGFRFKKWESYEETSGLSFPDNHIVNSYTAIFDFNKPCRKHEIENEVKADLDLLFLQEDG